MHRKYSIYFCGLFFIINNLSYSYANVNLENTQEGIQSLQLNRISTLWRLSFDSITMPDKNESMGLLGFNYMVKINSLMNAGIGGYSAIKGDQGGLFVLGIQGEVYHSLISKFWLRYGMFFGGGGGKIGTGNGSMIRSHMGISYDFDRFKVGSNYSYVSFLDSKISDKQISLSVTIPAHFHYANPNFIGKKINNLNMIKHKYGLDKIVFNRIYMAIVLQNYFQKLGTQNTSGQVQDNTIWLTGIEFGRFITKNTYVLLKTAGAFKGNPHGYMDFLAGIGYNYPLTSQYFSLSGEITAGAGGGGHVETGGEFLLETNIGLKFSLTPNIAWEIASGYLNSPNGNFKAMSLTSSLFYSMGIAEIVPTHNMESSADSYTFDTWVIRITNLIYRTPKRANNIANDDVHLICIKFDKLLNNYFFLTGQAHSAYVGKYVGGYAAGMLGVGMQSKGIFSD